MPEKDKILAGRRTVEAYQEAHRQLHAGGWHRRLSEEHTPLYNTMLAEFVRLGFTYEEFRDASYRLEITETGILDRRQSREDLLLLGDSAEDNGVKLQAIEGRFGAEMELIIDSECVMSTIPEEHIVMEQAVAVCPDNARVFIGGLGLSLVLLYLAQSGKANEVLVCEIDDRVIRLLGQRISDWFAQNYTDFNLTILKGDTFEEISKQGKFDWVYIDLTAPTPKDFEQLVLPILNEEGAYTFYVPYDRSEKW